MKLVIFPSPLDAACTLTHDTGGWSLTGVPDVDPSGRPGQSFTIPDTTPDQNGAALTVKATGYQSLQLRGILFLHPSPSLRVDDFQLVKGVTLPRLAVNGQFLVQS